MADPAYAAPPSERSRDRLYTGAFAAGLLALVAAVLALPVFPSGDGPVHLYYARILALLVTHKGGVYAAVYFVRHLVQPYSLHYFWLIGSEHFSSAAVAEKSFVAAILLVNALGSRTLARQLGPSAAPVSLAILPLLLSWALGSGFLNFCFAAGIMFYAYAVSLRLGERTTARDGALYLVALLLLVLSHPVPLLLLLLLLMGDLVLAAWEALRTGQETGWGGVRRRSGWFALACVAFIFPMLIADKAAVADSLLRDLRPHVAQVRAIVSGDRLSLFYAGTVPGVLFTGVLIALAPLGVWLLAQDGAVRRLREGRSRAADRLCLTALALLLATIVFPQSMNGSALFADRMVPLLWPLLCVGAAAVPLRPRMQAVVAGLGLLAGAASLVFALVYLLPAARQQEALDGAPLPRDARGLFVAAPTVRRPFSVHLAGQLLGWGGARAFAEHDDVLVNSPWMQLTIVPIGEHGRSGLLRDRLAGSYSESPVALATLLAGHAEGSAAALEGADFVLFSDPAAAASAGVQNEAARLLPTAGWHCEAHDFYAVCVRKGVR